MPSCTGDGVGSVVGLVVVDVVVFVVVVLVEVGDGEPDGVVLGDPVGLGVLDVDEVVVGAGARSRSTLRDGKGKRSQA
jgi:hypothetical protein